MLEWVDCLIESTNIFKHTIFYYDFSNKHYRIWILSRYWILWILLILLIELINIDICWYYWLLIFIYEINILSNHLNRWTKHHCLKVLGLLALKILLYLFWLALGVLLTMGNLKLFSLNKCDLGLRISSLLFKTAVLIMEMVSLEALWLPAISICNWLTAPLSVISLYSLYILWIPVLDWYLRTIPKVFTWLGLRSKI